MKPTDESRVRLIPIDRIRVVNPRARDKAKFEHIVESIAKLGLKKPITVTIGKTGEDGVETFDLVCGQGRLEAFQALGQTEIPALVRGLSKTDGLLASLIENIARRRVRALDQIKMIQWMIPAIRCWCWQRAWRSSRASPGKCRKLSASSEKNCSRNSRDFARNTSRPPQTPPLTCARFSPHTRSS